jgi:DNA polymerase-1
MATDDETFYFNFKDYEEVDYPRDAGLSTYHMEAIAHLLSADRSRVIFLHNAKFDMAMLVKEGVYILSDIWCTMAAARVVYNNHMTYNLADCCERIGLAKDDAVEKYIDEHHLWEWKSIPGKRTRVKNKHYDQVPFEIMAKYAQIDARITYQLGLHQMQEIKKVDDENPEGVPPMSAVAANERRLTRTVHRMEQVGLRIDRDFCVRAAQHEALLAETAIQNFESTTGRKFSASPKLFAEVFASDKERWEYTEKNNPSFEGDVLETFQNPAARNVLEYRDAKSKSDFYTGFLYHADARGFVHPNLNADGTATGRFSSSNPNFQNLKSEENEDLTQEFVVRRAVIPREGHIFFMPDYEQMEYKLMLELACRRLGRSTPLADVVRGGADFHQSVTDMVNAITGKSYKRKAVKNVVFAKIYGAGKDKLTAMLGCTLKETWELINAINKVSPEMDTLCEEIIAVAKTRGFLFNWRGRRSYFPDSNFGYKGPNYLVQGGCADVVKVAMNKIDSILHGTDSRMILQVHDELLIEIPEGRGDSLPKEIQQIMLDAFPAKYVPLTSSAEWSGKSMADKQKGYPQ